ncbi:MAG TPA: hypothetical protein VK869_04845 [Rubrobacteraceae bacterium]|nr:hypothetical protein [Rubrobacteraceae bacterium]
MSTLSAELKRRTKMWATGVALSVATFAILPGVADAQAIGDARNINGADHTVGQVAAQNAVNGGTNLNASPNASLASPGSRQQTGNSQSITGGYNGSTRNVNGADHTVGQVVGQDALGLNHNVNASPGVAVASPRSYQRTDNTQRVTGGYGGTRQHYNQASYTVGQVTVQNGISSGANLNASPNVSVLSPGSGQESGDVQNLNASGSTGNGGGAQNTNSADHTIGQAALQEGVNANINANASPNVAVASPGSGQGTGNAQGSGGSAGSEGSNNRADRTVGQVVGQDMADLAINTNVSPNVSELSPASKQETGNDQNAGGSNDSASSGGGAGSDNYADYTVGQFALQDGVDSSANVNASPNVSVLSPNSQQESGNLQDAGTRSANGGNSAAGDARNSNGADHTVGQAVLQDGVDGSTNANISPNVSVLSPGSKQESGNSQNFENSGNSGAQNENRADHSAGQIAVQDGVNLEGSVNASPNVSVLSPDSEQTTGNSQDTSSDSNQDRSEGGERNTNNSDHTVGQVVLQDGVDGSTNANISPNASVLSPGSRQDGANDQSTVPSDTGDSSGSERNGNEADHTIGQVALQDVADLNINANISPNASILSSDSEQDTDNQQSISSGSASNDGSRKNTNSGEYTIGQVVGQDGVDGNTSTNVNPNVSVLSPGSEQETNNCQGIDGNNCASESTPGDDDTGSSPGDDIGGDNGEGSGVDPDDRGTDGSPDDGSTGGDTNGGSSGGSGDDAGSDPGDSAGDRAGADDVTGANVSGSDGNADSGFVAASVHTVSPVFVASHSPETTLSTVELRFADTAPMEDRHFLSATHEVGDFRPSRGEAGSLVASRASSETPAAGGMVSVQANIGSLPDTGGAKLWQAPLGLLLLMTGLLVARKRWVEVLTRN